MKGTRWPSPCMTAGESWPDGGYSKHGPSAVPGPGAYSPTSRSINSPVKMTSSETASRFPQPKQQIPGPDAYHLKASRPSPTSVKMVPEGRGSRLPQPMAVHAHTPGPADYVVKGRISSKVAVKIGLTSKEWHGERGVGVPGPGAYLGVTKADTKIPGRGKVFGKSERWPSPYMPEDGEVWTSSARHASSPVWSRPGPGSYSPCRAPSSRSPVKMMPPACGGGAGDKTPQPTQEMIARPGPGSYNTIGQGCLTSPTSAVMRPKSAQSRLPPSPTGVYPDVPGPGSYHTVDRKSREGGKFSHGGKYPVEPRASPGPGDYGARPLPQGTKYSFRGKEVYMVDPRVPGPSHYSPQKPTSSISYSFSREGKDWGLDRLQERVGDQIHEQFRDEYWGAKGSKRPSRSQARWLSRTTRMYDVPGPGAYRGEGRAEMGRISQAKSQAPRCTFGRSKRSGWQWSSLGNVHHRSRLQESLNGVEHERVFS